MEQLVSTSSEPISEQKEVYCYHCGTLCDTPRYRKAEKQFCCEGCQLVFELLEEHQLCTYYSLNEGPGRLQAKDEQQQASFEFLNTPSVKELLIDFKEGDSLRCRFWIPAMHCSSCVWLLENLNRLHQGIEQSRVNFPKKEVQIVFNEQQISLSEVAALLTKIGYEPHFNLQEAQSQEQAPKQQRKAWYKIGIAGFCFGNSMMLNFPDYLSGGNLDPTLSQFLGYLNLLLALPVVFFAGNEFFISAYKSLRQRFLNIDGPIALAIAVTFLRSVYEIVTHSGPGYIDSMCGIVFFMLLGRYFQTSSYARIAFNRDYRSFFPLAVTRLNQGKEEIVSLQELQEGDVLRIRNKELIPADALLLSEGISIDYSFVSGESTPIFKKKGDLVYAGGLLEGGAALLQLVKKSSNSYLSDLWNNQVFQDREKDNERFSFIHPISRYFALVTLAIATAAASYWAIQGEGALAINAFTAVLIIACPCVLLLAASFTYGNTLAHLRKAGFYAKNATTIEKMADLNCIVFDKTGTITLQQRSALEYEGLPLSDIEKECIQKICQQSRHPLSKLLAEQLPIGASIELFDFQEIAGKGLQAEALGRFFQVGNFETRAESSITQHTRIDIGINGIIQGYYLVKNQYRPHLEAILASLQPNQEVYVLSGDKEGERSHLAQFIPNERLHFQQSPSNKLQFIASLQQEGKKVLMVGDGLNDAGALAQSTVGMAVSDSDTYFTPACDVIVQGQQLYRLPDILRFCRWSIGVIWLSFGFAVLYNLCGIYFSVQGQLSPMIAAILMPCSTVSIVLIAGLGTYYASKKYHLHSPE